MSLLVPSPLLAQNQFLSLRIASSTVSCIRCVDHRFFFFRSFPDEVLLVCLSSRLLLGPFVATYKSSIDGFGESAVFFFFFNIEKIHVALLTSLYK